MLGLLSSYLCIYILHKSNGQDSLTGILYVVCTKCSYESEKRAFRYSTPSKMECVYLWLISLNGFKTIFEKPGDRIVGVSVLKLIFLDVWFVLHFDFRDIICCNFCLFVCICLQSLAACLGQDSLKRDHLNGTYPG